MVDKLSEYMHDSLKRFIQYHVDQGYSKDSLVKCLTGYGYSRVELNKAFANVPINPKKIDERYSLKDLDGEAYYYLRGVISKYIQDQQKMGFDIKDIKEALIKYGHHKDLINDANAVLISKKEVRISREALGIFGFIVIGIFTFIMASTLEVTFMTMFRLISPAFITVLILYILADHFYNHKAFVPVFSIAVSIALFIAIIGIRKDPGINDAVLLLLNAGIATLVSISFMAAHTPKPKILNAKKKKNSKGKMPSNFKVLKPAKITKKEEDIKSTVEN